MGSLFGSDPLLFPTLGPAVLDLVRTLYGALLLATLAAALPHARRYFLSERWGGYGARGWWVDLVQNPIVQPLVLGTWLAAGVGLLTGRAVLPSAIVNAALCHYFFVQMRWCGVLRGMGAPGFITFWLGTAILLLELTRRAAPDVHGLALLVVQVDFALIMLSAGLYKLRAGYRRNEGMELGMVNPEWGYWPGFWARRRPGRPWFRLLNELAWGTEVVAAVLMLVPATRLLGGLLILVSFVFIATQIRLGFLCEMVIACSLLFAHAGSVVDVGAAGLWTSATPGATETPVLSTLLRAGLWGYLALLPLARAGMAYNLDARRTLPSAMQRLLDAYVNLCGLIIWRVFSADITNFFVRVHEAAPGGARRLVSDWGAGLRYRQVAEAITVTSLFTTLKYYPGDDRLFRERLLRYARTVPCAEGHALVFEYVSIRKGEQGFAFVPAAEFYVDPRASTVDPRILDPTVSLHAPAAGSPVHAGARPGSYAPWRS